jgi:integrase
MAMDMDQGTEQGTEASKRPHDTRLNRLKAIDLSRIKKPGMYADGGGLYLQVRDGEHGLTRSWLLRFMRHGKARYMGLGPSRIISLAEARQKARVAHKLLLEGVDPIEAKEAHRAAQQVSAVPAMTFRQAAEAYIDAQAPGWRHGGRHGSEQQWRQTLRDYAYPVLGSLPVASIDTATVLRVLEPLWKTKTATAKRVQARIAAVLDWATVHGLRSGDNPARWTGFLDKALPARSEVRPVKHFAALPFVEAPAFMTLLRQRTEVPARVLEFVILTAARSEEVIGARWSEFDLAARVWTVPAERMKERREHRVPLSDAALAILEAMQGLRQSDFIFPGTKPNKPIANNGTLYVLRHMGRGDLTTHGFRATFRQWAAEETNFPREVAEVSLSHAIGDAVERTYQRGDLFKKRRQLMDAWAAFCAGDVAQEAGEKVVAFPARGGV